MKIKNILKWLTGSQHEAKKPAGKKVKTEWRVGESITSSNLIEICSTVALDCLNIDGENNTVIIRECGDGFRAAIRIKGNNNTIVINRNCRGTLKININSQAKEVNNTKVEIGENTYVGFPLVLEMPEDDVEVKIGKNCMFLSNVSIFPSDVHSIIDKDTGRLLNRSHYVEIGDRVWMGRDVRICKNVKIPSNTVVGQRALVTKAFAEEHVILAGIPAKIIKHNIDWNWFTPDILEAKEKKMGEKASEKEWEEHLPQEIKFWDQIIGGTFQVKEWCDNFKIRGNDENYCYDPLRGIIKKNDRILDVGSGPASVLGTHFDGEKLDLVAVDPLADEYKKLYKKYNNYPKVIPQYGTGENLNEYVTGKFDLIFSRNAMDHSYNPFKFIENMVSLLTKHGTILIIVGINEGVRENYSGLHKWNFLPLEDDVVIWNQIYESRLLSKIISKDMAIKVEQYSNPDICKIIITNQG